MSKRVFDVDAQNQDLAAKIVAGLERVAETFRVLLWDHAKKIGLSPIQIQLLIFTHYHAEEWCNVSDFAREFNMTKPTISDAVRVLHKKKLIQKIPSPTDGRAYHIQLTGEGKKIVQETADFGSPVYQVIADFKQDDQQHFYRLLNELVFKLNRKGVIQIQRSCQNCRFYQADGEERFCQFLGKPLSTSDLRLDCPEFEAAG